MAWTGADESVIPSQYDIVTKTFKQLFGFSNNDISRESVIKMNEQRKHLVNLRADLVSEFKKMTNAELETIINDSEYQAGEETKEVSEKVFNLNDKDVVNLSFNNEIAEFGGSQSFVVHWLVSSVEVVEQVLAEAWAADVAGWRHAALGLLAGLLSYLCIYVRIRNELESLVVSSDCLLSKL